jgi:hypothetical protein
LAASVQACRGRECDKALSLDPVIADGRHGENKPTLPQADGLDQDRTAGTGQHDHITGIDVASKDQILHD